MINNLLLLFLFVEYIFTLHSGRPSYCIIIKNIISIDIDKEISVASFSIRAAAPFVSHEWHLSASSTSLYVRTTFPPLAGPPPPTIDSGHRATSYRYAYYPLTTTLSRPPAFYLLLNTWTSTTRRQARTSNKFLFIITRNNYSECVLCAVCWEKAKIINQHLTS